jgi:hypothetical protein
MTTSLPRLGDGCGDGGFYRPSRRLPSRDGRPRGQEALHFDEKGPAHPARPDVSVLDPATINVAAGLIK